MVRGVGTTIVDETARGVAFSNLKETARRTSHIEASYLEAERLFTEAAAQLAGHRARYDQRARELEDLDGGNLISALDCRRPIAPATLTPAEG